ncbi:NUDIX domain-containing protein [Paenibacillus wynnii]|uniref:NUDIX domain-containing protein n=1 Tax=Paenibacillus wynnii TaxID=268407 RepID=UPI0027934232|nr:NUDIX domain-containing protein [Paenibacillus wynnii]MDQ0194582.1 8-oxo-dGTP diphosphatase [Paenibacillus wynnii]
MIINQGIEFGDNIDGITYRDRPGVYAVIEKENKIAVVKTKDRIFLPGGGIEGAESYQECLRRECSEELGCDIEVGYYIGNAAQYTFSFKDKQPLKIIGHFYFVTITGLNNLKIEDDHELVWLSSDKAIQSMDVEFQAWAINEYIKLR